MNDIGTIMWKEWRELLRARGNRRTTSLGQLVLLLVIGVFMPLQMGRMWVETPIALSYWALMPLILVTSIVADSFAGERERHTLETLHASRLSDRSILWGKIGAIVIYSWIVTQLTLLIALLPINSVDWNGHLQLYTWPIVLSAMALSLLLAGLMTMVGVLLSLRAATVRQAQQTLGLAVFAIAWSLPLLGWLGQRYLSPAMQQRILATIRGGNIGQIVLVILLALLAITAALLVVAHARFQRTRLILD